MPTYMYRAVTKTGQEVKNRVEESNRFSLIRKIKQNGLMPISVTQIRNTRNNKKQKRKNSENMDSVIRKVNANSTQQASATRKMSMKDRLNLLVQEKIRMRDVMVFTENFYLLKKANFNNIHALNTIIEGTENLAFRGVLEDILDGLEAGENMYTTMEYYSNIFPYIYINIIRVGELSGSLTESLKQAMEYLDETAAMNKRLKEILMPNIIQFVGIFIILIAGTLIAIPMIQDVITQVGSTEELPAVTLWFSDLLGKFMRHWYIPVFLLIAIAVGIWAYIRTPKGRYNYHYFKYTMPIFGPLIYAIDFERLMRAVLLNIKNGMRIQEALEVSKSVVKNYVMLSMIETSINNILIGQSWIEPFERSGLSSSMITEMLKIGMQTDLAEMMEKLLEYMQIDINNLIEKIMKVLPQILYIVVGILLIFMVCVVLVPVLQIYMGNFLFSAAGL